MAPILENAIFVERTGGAKIETINSMRAPSASAISFVFENNDFGTEGSNRMSEMVVLLTMKALITVDVLVGTERDEEG